MLRRITIRSFALIDAIDLEIGPGMTVLLGETGAGKSIIIDALAAALGERLPSDSLRTGARKAVLEASFDITGSDALRQILVANDLLWDSDELVVRRELTASGTSRCFVNDTPVQVGIVRAISEHLLDVHGQHDTHGLLNGSRHKDVLDMFAEVGGESADMAKAWDALTSARTFADSLVQRARTVDADRARLQFIVDEIASINPSSGEDVEIAAELRRAESREHVVQLAEIVRDGLYAGDVSAYDLIRKAIDAVRQLEPFRTDLDAVRADLESALVACKEAAGSVAALTDPDDFSPERLEDLRSRQVLLQRLVRKYGSLDAAVDERSRSEADMALLEDLDAARTQAEAAVASAEREARSVASKLTKRRRAAGPLLRDAITAAIATMGMPSASFAVEIEETELGPTGADRVTFLFSANAGEPLRPLAKVASGGELSRVMLAIKTAIAAKGRAGTMVFDEIDTGISGRVARTVGEVMKGLATTQQILCITHLPQIAGLADHFVRVRKNEAQGVTTVGAEPISTDDATHEIAKLLSGTDVTATSLAGAQELMGSPRVKKRTAR